MLTCVYRCTCAGVFVCVEAEVSLGAIPLVVVCLFVEIGSLVAPVLTQ